MIPIEQQISEIKRELSMRAAVYPGLIAKKKMRQGEADMHTARMTAVLETLVSLRDQDAGACNG